MGPARRPLTARLAVGVGSVLFAVLAGITLLASPALARPVRAGAYYVMLSVRGSFHYRFLGMAVGGFDQADTASWTYKDRFGPINGSATIALAPPPPRLPEPGPTR